MATKKLVKPERKESKPVYHWNDVQKYIEAKYKVQLRGYKGETNSKYRDFWHWLLDPY